MNDDREWPRPRLGREDRTASRPHVLINRARRAQDLNTAAVPP
jgi:hypothetical protein